MDEMPTMPVYHGFLPVYIRPSRPRMTLLSSQVRPTHGCLATTHKAVLQRDHPEAEHSTSGWMI